MTVKQLLASKKARTFVKKAKLRLGRRALQLSARLRPEQAAAWAEHLFITPERFRSSLNEEKLLARGSQASLQVGPDLLRVWRWGSGPDVLLLHGWSGRGGQFASWVDVLVEAGFRVTLLDAPGHGKSGGQTSSMVQFVHSLEAAQQQFGPFEAVIGHSLGGGAALIAAARGLNVRRLVTLGAPGSIDSVMDRAFRVKMGIGQALTERVLDRLVERFGMPLAELDPIRRAPELKQPLLVIHDLDDGEIPWSEAEALAAAAPKGELLTTKGLGHVRILRNPEVTLRVRDFLLGESAQPLASPEMERILGRY